MVDEALAEGDAVETEPKTSIDMSVEITDAGPCKKHVKVVIPRPEVEKFFDREFSELVQSAAVAGFRPGKAPRKLIERRFRKEVADKVKGSMLMQSLEQIGEEQKLDPLSEPELDVHSIEIPEDGDFLYEFDVEVRPQFALPDYKGLSIKRPTREFTNEDVEEAFQDFIRRHGTLVRKGAPATKGDYVLVDVRFVHAGDVVREFEDLTLRVDEELTFRDGVIERFLEGMAGAVEGDTREFKVHLSDSVSRQDLAGRTIDAVFIVKEVKDLVPPNLDSEFFERFGVADVGQIKDELRAGLERRLQQAQRQAATEQVMEKIVEHADLELPQDLLRRQAERTLRRTVLDLEYAGYSEEEIRARLNRLRQNSLAATAKSLKQQFVLQAIAEAEDIKVDLPDVEEEIAAIAERSGESARRVRARVEKEGLTDAIGMQVLERKTIDRILSYATTHDVPWKEERIASSAVDESAVPEPEASEPTPPDSSATAESN